MSRLSRAQPVEETSDSATPLADITLIASTAKQLVTVTTLCRCVLLTSDPANTAGTYIRVGDKTVDGTHGQKLAPGQSYLVTIYDASQVWLYTTGVGQVVQATVFA